MITPPLEKIAVIAPNLKKRLSGVTTTVLRLVPVQARMIGIVTTGFGLPLDLPRLSPWRLAFLPRDRWRVWHARRNTEMALGLVLRYILRRRLWLLFTSAAQRDHSDYTKVLIARMDAVIATSPQAAGYLESKAKVILHGVDTEEFRPANDKAALRYALGLPPGLLIGCFGRIRHQKGTDILVEVALRILPRHPEAKLVLTGRITPDNAAFADDLKSRIEAAGLSDRILWRGEVSWSDLVKHYQAIDLFVAPARWEGFGLTPIEAMACGVPAIATRTGAFEMQIVEGETGHLVEPGDAEDLAEAIDRLLSDHRNLTRMGPAGRAHVLDKFTITREAKEITAVYKDLLDRRPPFSPLTRLRLLADRYSGASHISGLSVPRDDLLDDLKGKRIAIVGNARALAETDFGDAIDDADLVIRINRAPRPTAQSHGARTDWLALATTLSRGQAREIDATRILWMSPKRKRLPLWAMNAGGFYLHPVEEITRLQDQLGAPPTTGLMMIDLVARSGAISIDLYGFDFFSSLSLTGSRSAADVPHDFAAEAAFARQLVNRDPRVRLHSMGQERHRSRPY